MLCVVVCAVGCVVTCPQTPCPSAFRCAVSRVATRADRRAVGRVADCGTPSDASAAVGRRQRTGPTAEALERVGRARWRLAFRPSNASARGGRGAQAGDGRRLRPGGTLRPGGAGGHFRGGTRRHRRREGSRLEGKGLCALVPGRPRSSVCVQPRCARVGGRRGNGRRGVRRPASPRRCAQRVWPPAAAPVRPGPACSPRAPQAQPLPPPPPPQAPPEEPASPPRPQRAPRP